MRRSTWILVTLLVLIGLMPAVGRTEGGEGDWEYRRAFCFDSDDGDWCLKLMGYVRLVGLYTDMEMDVEEGTYSDDETTFKVAHTYLITAGHLGDPNVKFLVGLLMTAEDELLDAFVDLTHIPEASLRMGQGWVFFSRSATVSASRLQFVDRDIVSKAFLVGRDVGATLHGGFLDGKLDYQLGLYNGNGRNSTSNPDDEFATIGRVAFAPLGKMPWIEGAVVPYEDLRLLVALKGLSNQVGWAVNEEGVETYVDRADLGLELVLGWQGLYVQSEYFSGTDEDQDGLDTDRTGFYGQVGYFVIPERLELAARFARLELDDGSVEISTDQTTLGLGYYMDGHYRKIQLNGTMTDRDGYEETKLEALFQIRF